MIPELGHGLVLSWLVVVLVRGFVLSWTSLVPSLEGGEQFGGVVGDGGFGGEVLFTELDGEVLQRA